MKMCRSLFFVFCFLFCSSVEMPAQSLKTTYENYVRSYYQLAIQHMEQYGIPASITLAQALLESRAGTSDLAFNTHNHFGIKCNSDWTGPCKTHADDTPNDQFRIYKSVEESYEDHSRFLQKPRYSMLFTLDISDYSAWARGLQQCGYATSPIYAENLITLIEGFALYRYDIQKTVKRPATPVSAYMQRVIYIDHGLLYVLAEEKDSYVQIAVDLGFNINKILKYNDALANQVLKKGEIVYLEMKNTRAKKPFREHIVRPGETMHSISQMYGMRMESLYKLNKKTSGYMVRVGDVLRLQ